MSENKKPHEKRRQRHGARAAGSGSGDKVKAREEKKLFFHDGTQLDTEPLRLYPDSNWMTFSDTMTVLAEKEYGALADLLKGKPFPKRPMPMYGQNYFDNDPHGLLKLQATSYRRSQGSRAIQPETKRRSKKDVRLDLVAPVGRVALARRRN